MKRIVFGALLSGSVALAGLGMGMGMDLGLQPAAGTANPFGGPTRLRGRGVTAWTQ